MQKIFKPPGNATANKYSFWSIRMHTSQYSGSWQPLIKSTKIEKSCQKHCLAKTVHSYLKLLVAPTRKPNLPNKPKLNTQTNKKAKTQVWGHTEESVCKPTSALGRETIYRIERNLKVNTNQSTSFKHPHLIQDRKEETWNLVEICF